MERGEYLDSPQLIAQSSAAIQKLNADNEALANLSKKIQTFVLDTELKGATYDSCKKQLNRYRYVLGLAQNTNAREIEDYNTIITKASYIGVVLDGTELRDSYDQMKQSEQTNRNTANEYRQKAEDTWDILFITKDYYYSQAEKYDRLADNAANLAAEIMKKMNLYDTFEEETCQLLTSTKNYRTGISNMIGELIDRYNSAIALCQPVVGEWCITISDFVENASDKFLKYYQINAGLLQEITEEDYERFEKDIEKFQKIFQENYETYKKLEEKTGVPAELIAALHYRESGGNFNTYLHNGAKLGTPSDLEPRGVCFNDFEEAAVNALTVKTKSYKIDFKKGVDMAKMVTFAESFNGFGYHQYNNNSPYVYSGTNLYEKGKYVGDHNYNPDTVDKQPGVYILISSLKKNEMENDSDEE